MNNLLNYAYFYRASLLAISVFVAGLERLLPRRRTQPVLRRALGWDLVHLVFNGHHYEGDAKSTKNFCVIFSCWDWAFGTAFMPAHVPARPRLSRGRGLPS